MLLWSCPVCGQETTLAHLNLITLFEWYLLATFFFSLAIRYQLYRSYVALFWSMPIFMVSTPMTLLKNWVDDALPWL